MDSKQRIIQLKAESENYEEEIKLYPKYISAHNNRKLTSEQLEKK